MTVWAFLLILAALVMAVVGLLGVFVPGLPGPPLGWLGLLVVYFVCPGQLSLALLLWMLAVTVAVTLLDFIAPGILTKMGGGSKAAARGATIGIFAGMFYLPLGLILGPLLGAFLGEMAHNSSDVANALKVSFMSFISFLLTTGLKLIACLLMLFYMVWAVWQFYA